jgi:hypothetical protein
MEKILPVEIRRVTIFLAKFRTADKKRSNASFWRIVMRKQNWIKKVVFIACLINMSGCAQFLNKRSFIGQMSEENDFYQPGEDFQLTQGDSGKTYRTRDEYVRRTPASSSDHFFEKNNQDSSLRQEIAYKESTLRDEERDQYQEFTALNADPSARIYFLNLPPSERGLYLQALQSEGAKESEHIGVSSIGFLEERKRYEGAVQLGMSKDEVMQLWGAPTREDYAGDPALENVRWTYYQGDKVKKVFFEQGAVGGWNLE